MRHHSFPRLTPLRSGTTPLKPSAKPVAVVRLDPEGRDGLRVLTADDVIKIKQLRERGIRVVDIAKRYGCSRRTIYRWLQSGEIITVTIPGWTARFCLSRPSNYADVADVPVQMEPWRSTIPCDDCHRTDGTHDLTIEH